MKSAKQMRAENGRLVQQRATLTKEIVRMERVNLAAQKTIDSNSEKIRRGYEKLDELVERINGNDRDIANAGMTYHAKRRRSR